MALKSSIKASTAGRVASRRGQVVVPKCTSAAKAVVSGVAMSSSAGIFKVRGKFSSCNTAQVLSWAAPSDHDLDILCSPRLVAAALLPASACVRLLA